MSEHFEIGRAYYASPALKGAAQRIVIPIGREGDEIQFAFVDALANARANADVGFGREFVRLNIGDGQVYSCSCAVAVPASESARVLSILKGIVA